MPKFLVMANYVGGGMTGLMSEGGSRRVEAATAAIESVGGTLECMYYAFGDNDVYAICDVPDVATATALSMTFNSSGSIEVKLIPLITPEEVDTAASKTPNYRPPGT